MLILLGLGCAKATPAATPAKLEPGPAVEAPAAPQVEVPESAQRLRGLLQARHPEDLPDKAAMDVHGAPGTLQWLASNDAMLIVRERALLGLRYYSDAPSQALCAEVFGSDAHAKLRAASVTCLGGSDLAADAPLREKLITALRDPDPRVGVAAARVLAEVPAARPALEAASTDPAVQAAVQETCQKAL